MSKKRHRKRTNEPRWFREFSNIVGRDGLFAAWDNRTKNALLFDSVWTGEKVAVYHHTDRKLVIGKVIRYADGWEQIGSLVAQNCKPRLAGK